MSDALREIFAEFKIAVDLEALEKLEQKLRAVIGVENEATNAADAAGKAAKKQAADAAKAAKKQAADAAKAAEKEAAAKAKLTDVEAARQKAQDSATQAKTDHEGQKLFDASDEGKAHAAWKRLAEVEAAAQGPVTGLLGLLDRFQQKTTASIGQRLPASLQKVMQGLGVVDGDFAAMGQIAVASAGVAVAGITRMVVALHSFATSFAATSEQLRDVSADAGVTTSEFQSMAHAGVQSGVGADRLTRAMSSLHQQMQAGRLQGGGINWTLRRLGVESRTAGRGIRSASDVMNDLAQSFDRIQNPIRKDRIGVRLFGQDWYRLREVMHGGEGGIAALRAQMEALGGGVLPEAVEASRRFTQATGRLGVAQDSLRSVLAVGVLPVFTWLTEKAALVVGWWSRMTRGSQLVQVMLKALAGAALLAGGAMLIAFAPVLLPIAKVAAAAALLALAFDDIAVFLKGGNSLLGVFLDRMGGVGTARAFVQQLREAWEGLKLVTSSVGNDLKYVFGTELGQELRDIAGLVERLDQALQRVGTSLRGVGSALALRGMLGNFAFGNQSAAAVAGGGAGAPAGPVVHGLVPSQPAHSNVLQTLANVPGDVLAGWSGVFGGHRAAVPATQTVAAPGNHGARPIVRTTQHINHNTWHLSGTDPRATAQEAVRLMEARAREQRDADHPQPGDDD